jgi:hypothetical protein
MVMARPAAFGWFGTNTLGLALEASSALVFAFASPEGMVAGKSLNTDTGGRDELETTTEPLAKD